MAEIDRCIGTAAEAEAAAGTATGTETGAADLAGLADGMLELLVYMVTSADGLRGEPDIYGPLRLIEASQRLSVMLAQVDPKRSAGLEELVDLIAQRKNDSMYDQESFYQMLHDASAKLVDLY